MLQRLLSGTHFVELETGRLERRAYELPDRKFILNEKYPGGVAHVLLAAMASVSTFGVASSRGNWIVKRAPPAGLLATEIVPPCAVTIALQIASPSPTPRRPS